MSDSQFVRLDPSTIKIGANVRTDLHADAREFARSIKERGVLEPVTVYADEDGAYVVLRGQRRTVVAAEVGLPDIPAQVVAKPDDLTADLEAPAVVEDESAEAPSIEGDGTDVVEEHVVAEVVAAPTETETGEPVLGWLPTWTTEIRLVDYEPTVDDERETTRAEADDLSAALLAEIPQGDDSVGTQEEDEYPAATYESGVRSPLAPTEPSFGMTGKTPCFRRSTRRRSVSWRMPL